MYILGTGALLVYIPPGKIDLAAPLQQVMQAGFGNWRLWDNSDGGDDRRYCSMYRLRARSRSSRMTARLPMVIGWDGLLPEWWSHLHPKFRTPVKALAHHDWRVHCGRAAEFLGSGRPGDYSDRYRRRDGLPVHHVHFAVLGDACSGSMLPEVRIGIGGPVGRAFRFPGLRWRRCRSRFCLSRACLTPGFSR